MNSFNWIDFIDSWHNNTYTSLTLYQPSSFVMAATLYGSHMSSYAYSSFRYGAYSYGSYQYSSYAQTSICSCGFDITTIEEYQNLPIVIRLEPLNMFGYGMELI